MQDFYNHVARKLDRGSANLIALVDQVLLQQDANQTDLHRVESELYYIANDQ